MKKTKWFLLMVFLQVSMIQSNAHAVPVEVTEVIGGTLQLTGINGIEVLGKTWNIRFIDGTFNDIFIDENGLDFNSGNFSGVAEANVALAEAFESIIPTIYDTNPERTAGIASEIQGQILTPWNITNSKVNIGVFRNLANDAPNHIDVRSVFGTNSVGLNYDTSGTDQVYAKWTVTAVPVTGALWLMSTGLLSLMGYYRKNKAQAVTL